MKKHFAIKATLTSKNAILAVAKNETANILKFTKPADCCVVMAMNGLTGKPVFSL